MRTAGYWVIAAGVIYLVIAFNMTVSVTTPTEYIPYVGVVGGGEVANLDLMARRQNHLMVAGLITLIGALMAIFGKDGGDETAAASAPAKPQAAKAEFDGDRGLSNDAYRLWLARKYGIERNDVFDKFIFNDSTFDSLDEALIAAHEVEESELQKRREDAEAKEEALRLQREENEHAQLEAEEEWERNKHKVAVGGLIALALAVGGYLVFRETPEEKAARLVAEDEAQAEKIREISSQFGIRLPEDAWGIRVDKNTAMHFLCDDREGGTLLTFFTENTEKVVQERLAETLGDGTRKYEYSDDDFDWQWTKDSQYYELTSFSTDVPREINLCIVDTS